MSVLLSVGIAGCSFGDPAPAARLDGLWEVHTEGARAPAWLAAYDGCSWGRETWLFGESFVEIGRDVLCPMRVPGEHGGCHAAVRSDAGWDDVDEAWVVGTTATTHVQRKTTPSHETLVQCDAEVEAGRYRVRRVADRPWRWEVDGPNGSIKLKVPQSTEPDYAGAILAARSEP